MGSAEGGEGGAREEIAGVAGGRQDAVKEGTAVQTGGDKGESREEPVKSAGGGKVSEGRCVECGEKLLPNCKYCLKCGTERPLARAGKKSYESKLMLALAALLILGFVLVTAVYLLAGIRFVPASATTTTTTTTSTSTTTTTMSTTTSTTTTSTSTTTTSTTIMIACSVNLDCGNITELRVCNQGDVFLRRTTPLCQDPGTQYSKCVQKSSMAQSPKEKCPHPKVCKNGECVYAD